MGTVGLFIGVVSHEGSRFAVSQGPQGLAARLATLIPDTVVRVLTENLWDAHLRPVTTAMVQDTLSAELHLDRRWRTYLGTGKGARWWATHTARWAHRGWRRLTPPPVTSVLRLLNIELSHLQLMRQGLASGASWVLILEDDAASAIPEDLAHGLEGLMHSPREISFVNLSRSFTLEELGINHLLEPGKAMPWQGDSAREVIPVSKPVTNTVCAILYRADFLASLIDAIDALPLEPVVPIDWKLNLALLEMMTDKDTIAQCMMVEPPPITQMSMADPAILLP